MPVRSPQVLAALATAAVPGLEVVAAGPAENDGADFDVAVLLDAAGRRLTARAPR
ncbi:aminoglycoside phosphotransferase, partial [Kineococcus sp. T90]|nr:aminoglycoside phosphotransferase [Kineococcus indalonis]